MTGDDAGGFLDREALLGGSPERRAATLLFLIETRTVKLTAQARQRIVQPLSEASAQERALEFVEAFSAAREAAVQPSIHDLERQADRWAPLVPRNPRLQAALAHRVGEKYRFTARVVPRLRKAIGVDDPEVQEAYRSLYGEPVESIYADRLAQRERLRWAWTSAARRLESLPPFWTAYGLTLTETVGADILALPIAVAAIGPLPAVGVLVAIGLVNVLTVSFMAEAVVRTGPMRYSNAYLGRLYQSALGARGSIPASALLIGLAFVWIPICYIGIGRTLGALTPVPAAVWVVAVFGLSVLYLVRGSLDTTVATALAVGAVNLVLILTLCGLGAPHVHGANLAHDGLPFVHGHPFSASAISLVLGVILMGYFGHFSAPTCGSLVLERDPSGRALIRGCAAAQVTAIVVYSLFVLTTNGAVGVHLAGVGGTVVSPLAHIAGPGVSVAGAVLVVLALGLSSLMEGLSLTWLVRERLPKSGPRVFVLPRRRARLVFRARGLRVGLTYLGGSRFAVATERSGRLAHDELHVSGHAEVMREGRHRVALDVLEADNRRVRVAVTSTLRVGYEGELADAGLDLAETLGLSDGEAALVASLTRSGESSAATVAASAGTTEQEAAATLAALVAHGLVTERETPDGPVYATRLAPRRARSSPVWEALTGARTQPAPAPAPRRRSPLESRAGRLVVSVLPLGLAFALSEYLLIAGVGSFAGLLSVLGIIAVSLLGGLYPVLLIVAGRRNGEYAPPVGRRLFAHPALLAAIYVFFLAVLVLHGTVIWTHPAERVAAFAAAATMVALTVSLVRGHAFGRRITIELCDDQRSGTGRFAVLSGGRPVPGEVTLDYGGREERLTAGSGEIRSFASLSRASFGLAGSPATELKVWAHRVTPEGETEGLAATAATGGRTADLSLSSGEALFPLGAGGGRVEVELGVER